MVKVLWVRMGTHFYISMDKFFSMAMLYSVHELAKVGEYFSHFNSFAVLVLYQFHQSSTFAVAHLNEERAFSAP